MRRSLLFIPSNNPAMLQNADIFGADKDRRQYNRGGTGSWRKSYKSIF